MAPINDQLSYSVHSSASTRTPFSCMCRGGSLSDGWEWFLPITRRGHFFQDSFFENSRSHFDAAIRDILGRWGDNKMLTDACHDTANNLSLYRQLRSRDLKEENQAVTVSYDSKSHKIVLDVHDFMNGEVKVKVIGEKEVRVEGVSEMKKETEASSLKFSRRFILPEDTKLEAISSVMSSDGMLTITIPKKQSSDIGKEVTRIIDIKNVSSGNTSTLSNTATESKKEASNTTSKSEKTKGTKASERLCECCFKKMQAGKEVPEASKQLDGMNIPIRISSTSMGKGNTLESLGKKQNTVDSNTYCERKKTSDSNDNQTNCSSLRKKEESQFSNQFQTTMPLDSNERSSVSSTDVKTSFIDKDEASRRIPISVNVHPLLPIMRRGLFFNDSIFENARNDFQSAVQEVLSKWGERSSLMDDLSCYRSLRTRDLREENQAIKVNEDENNHKFVLDVHDFMNGGEVNVKAINDRELAVEGQVDKQEGGSKSVKRFFKRFVVPSDIILGSVTSVMSSDGVLTITAPKKLPTIEIRDVTSPVRSEKSQEISSHRKQESFNEEQNAAASKRINECCESASKVHQRSSHQTNLAMGHIIPVQVEDRSNEVKVDNNIQMTKISIDSEKPQDKTMMNSESSEVVKANTGRSNTNSRREIEITKNNGLSSGKNVQLSNVNQQSLNTDSLNRSSVGRCLPIVRKGSFFNDSFFEGSRHSFQTAVSDVLQKFNNENSQADDITAYRGLRQRSLPYENLALNVDEDELCHKVVLDAQDFTHGDITVTVLGKRELLIEGRTETKKDSSASSQRFSQRFLLPDSVDIHSITSAISSDGVLTVESPKSGVSSLSNVKKMSSEAQSKKESHNDSGHKWEEKAVKESSEQSQGYNSRSYSKSYRSHHEQSSPSAF